MYIYLYILYILQRHWPCVVDPVDDLLLILEAGHAHHGTKDLVLHAS